MYTSMLSLWSPRALRGRGLVGLYLLSSCHCYGTVVGEFLGLCKIILLVSSWPCCPCSILLLAEFLSLLRSSCSPGSILPHFNAGRLSGKHVPIRMRARLMLYGREDRVAEASSASVKAIRTKRSSSPPFPFFPPTDQAETREIINADRALITSTAHCTYLS